MKKYIILQALLAMSSISYACPLCNKQISDAIYNSAFYPNLFIMLSAFIVLAIIVAVLTVLATRKYKLRAAANPHVLVLSPVPLTTASMILGIGLGGFIDGIVLHQILQVHEMLSNKIPSTNYIGKSVNMFWDGIFHAFCLVVVFTGIVLLWKLLSKKNIDYSGKVLCGGLLSGWAIFNIIEGIIDHQVLKLHNVIEFSRNHNTGNYIFLGISVIMLVAGYILINKRNGLHT